MSTSLQIVIGLAVGIAGAFYIPTSPLSGCSALMIGGLLILEGVNHLW